MPELPNRCFFWVLMLPSRFVTFCKIGLMERQKIITFKKKVSQKIFICRRDMLFSRANKCGIYPQILIFSLGNQWKLKISNIDFHWISFGNVPDFRGNFTLLCSWKWYISSTNTYFLINFFLKVIIFWRSINHILQNVPKRLGSMRTQKKHLFWSSGNFCWRALHEIRESSLYTQRGHGPIRVSARGIV